MSGAGAPELSAPSDRSTAGWWLLYAVFGFVTGQLAALIFLSIAAAVAHRGATLTHYATAASPPEWYIAASLVGVWVGFLIGPLLGSYVKGTRHPIRDLGLRFAWWDLMGIPIGVGSQYLIEAAYTPFKAHLSHFTAPTTHLTGSSHGVGFLVVAVLTVLGAPFFEELFFRGLLLRALTGLLGSTESARRGARILGTSTAIALDGAIFGIVHGELEQFAGLAFFGVVLAIVSLRTKRLGMNMAAHAAFNAVAIATIFIKHTGVVR